MHYIHVQQLKSSEFKHALCIAESCCQTFGVDGTSHVEGWPVSSVFLRVAFVKLLVVSRHILHPKAHTPVSTLWDTCDFHLVISLQHPAIVKIIMTVWGRRRPFSGKWRSQYLRCPWLSGVSGVSVTPWLSELRSGVNEDAFNVGQAFLHDVTGILHDFWDGLKRNITTDISSNTRSWDILGIHLALRVLFGKFF